MSPIFGVDLHPGYQASFDFKRAKRAGYRFAFVKASEGSHYVPEGFGEYFRRGAGAGLVMGGYHFLDGHGGTGRQQALHFLNTMDKVGGVHGKLIAVDFEDYGNRDPSNQQLAECVRTIKDQTNEHAVIIYSIARFWDGGDASGAFEHYEADAAWEARVWYDDERRRFPRRFYKKWLDWYHDQSPRGLGGKPARFHQFTWGGRVGGLYVDTDAFRGDMDDLLKLTTRSGR
jgi:GH25 family lysozyme M1 (1,4-beta-N-acetylmuramidase)